MLHDIRARFTALGADPDSRVDVAIAAGSLMLGLFSFGTLVAVGYLNYTKLPWFDGWDHWIRYLSAGTSWTFLFSMHTEHRIPVSRLLNLADQHWFNADTRFLMWCTFLAQIGSALILFRLACFSAGNLSLAFRTTILGLILAFAFAASQWINFTMTFQACFVVVFFAAIAAFAALKNSIQGPSAEERSLSVFWVIVSILMGLISTGSMANGLLVWPLMVLMAACMGLPKKVVGSLALVGVAVTVAYMRGYQPRAEVHVSNSWMRTPEVVAFASAYLGSALDEPLVAITRAVGLEWESYRVPLSALAGALGMGWFCYLVVLTIREPHNRRPARIAILCFLAFLAASAALTAVGRVQFPMKDALTSRYVTPSLLFWASLLAIAIPASATRRRSNVPAHSHVLRVAAFVAAAVVGGLVQLPKVAYAADAERYLSEGEYALINSVFVPEVWDRFIGSASGRMIPVVRYFREQHLASFSPEWTRWIGDPVRAHFLMASSDSDCIGAWESVTRVGGSFNPAVLAVGWGYDRRSNREPERIVITDGMRRIVGFAPLTRRRPDLLPAHPELSNHRVGWVSYLPASLSSDMTAYLLLGDGRTLCRGGGAHVPGNYLTAAAVRAGGIIGGVEVSAHGTWVRDLPPPGAAPPPFATEAWSSQTLSAGTGVLRLGPVTATAGMSIGLPLITGPGASAIRVSVIERGTGEVLATTNPPAGKSSWDLWRLDMPTGAPAIVVDYVVEQGANSEGDWVMVGLPRLIMP